MRQSSCRDKSTEPPHNRGLFLPKKSTFLQQKTKKGKVQISEQMQIICYGCVIWVKSWKLEALIRAGSGVISVNVDCREEDLGRGCFCCQNWVSKWQNRNTETKIYLDCLALSWSDHHQINDDKDDDDDDEVKYDKDDATLAGKLVHSRSTGRLRGSVTSEPDQWP